MFLNILMVLGGITLLFLGGNYLVKSSVALATILKIPKMIIGMTIVSFATSAPELIVSINAALDGSSAIALGNVMGSNIANIGLILGIILLFTPIQIKPTFYKSDWPFLMIISILFAILLVLTSGLARWEGGLLLIAIIGFIFYLIRFQTRSDNINEKPSSETEADLPVWQAFLYLALSGVALWLGSEWMVKGASSLAKSFGVSERVIAISVVAVGTSIPELAASLIAIAKKEKAIGLGNVIGSNIFNIGSVLGITALLLPIPVTDNRFIEFDIYIMLLVSFILLPMVFLPKGLTLSRWEGITLLILYIGFIYLSLGNP